MKYFKYAFLALFIEVALFSMPVHKLNLGVISWAEIIWVVVVVLPGFVPLGRGLIPPAIWIVGAILTTIGRRTGSEGLVLSPSERRPA